MKTLPKLCLFTAGVLLLTADPLFAGPGGNTPPRRAPRETTIAFYVAPKNCDRMTVNRNEKLGGNTVLACTNAVKQTPECVRACR